MTSSKLLFLVSTALLLGTQNTLAQDTKESAPTSAKQTLTQSVHGRVLDGASQQALTGVIVVLASNTNINASTDENGYFVLSNVPLGRQTFVFTYMGFETFMAREIAIISGKQPELNVQMNESLKQLDEVTITGTRDKIKPMNEFATVSARSFSVEETRRYAASFSDPARMVMNFPGVSNSGDMDNGIVVRGNSPTGVLWRLEGIEIPNPNHFSTLGATGGAVSMLNANTLGSSDFYTGAFAPEIGNALSGVFDINLRNGNTERSEHTVQLGVMGVELATEGPFKKGKKASYLFNYRYSTLALIEQIVNVSDGALPKYQDAALKINLPTEKAGTFSLFGLGGYNAVDVKAVADSSKWNEETEDNGTNLTNRSRMGVAGISHQYSLNSNAYIKTIISGSHSRSLQEADTLNPGESYRKDPVEHTSLINNAYRASILYNQKLSARHTLRTGIIAQQLGYDLTSKYYSGIDKQWKDVLVSDGSTQFYQAYIQWKARLAEKLTLVGGAHGSYLALNGKYSIEPRASLAYQMNNSKITLAAGLHSKPEHISTYLFENSVKGTKLTYPNKNLDLSRAFHGVAGYSVTLFGNLSVKTEVYYQHLYSVPVERDTASSFSMINAENYYSLLALNQPMVNEGTGENYGIDISIERPFSKGYYILATGSLYNSTYTNYKGDRYNTRYNRGHQLNVIGGKEFKVGKNILGLNGKVMYSGGQRESLIDKNESILQGQQIIVKGKYFTEKAPAYFRLDAGAYYKMNGKKATHSIQLDVQNVMNRENYYFSYFDTETASIKRVNQLGILPVLSYRVDFHW